MSFKRLDSEDFTFGAALTSAPVWSNFSSSLLSFNKSPIQQVSDSGQYYIDVYNNDPASSPNAKIQFAITYGDVDGSGSLWYNPLNPGSSPTRTVYGQFVNLLLGEDEGASFNFGLNGPQSFFALTINRTHYKQALLPGSLQIRGLAPGGAYITDNSRVTSVVDYTPAGRRFTLGSGSFGDGVMPAGSVNGVHGYLYPDIGIIILNPLAFDPTILNDPINPVWLRDSNINSNNPDRLRQKLTQFSLQNEETITSNYIFCRARNAEFGYSTNPSFTFSFFSSSLNDFIQTPSTYITSVGLYNNNNELLAVAKLSKPLKKDFTSEALIRVKLDF